MYWLNCHFEHFYPVRHVQYLALTGLCLEMSKLSSLDAPFPYQMTSHWAIRWGGAPSNFVVYHFVYFLIDFPSFAGQFQVVLYIYILPTRGEIPRSLFPEFQKKSWNLCFNWSSLQPPRKQDNQEGGSKGGRGWSSRREESSLVTYISSAGTLKKVDAFQLSKSEIFLFQAFSRGLVQRLLD